MTRKSFFKTLFGLPLVGPLAAKALTAPMCKGRKWSFLVYTDVVSESSVIPPHALSKYCEMVRQHADYLSCSGTDYREGDLYSALLCDGQTPKDPLP